GEDAVTPIEKGAAPDVTGPAGLTKQWQALQERVAALPGPVRDKARAGLRKTVDFQNVDYGVAYLDRIDGILAKDSAKQGYLLTREAAKHIANAMAYDDIIKVADLKTREARFSRINREMGLTGGQRIKLTEYFHPRASEIAGLMPARLGAWLEASSSRMARLDRWFGKGRHLRSDRVTAFVMLYLLGGQKSWRLKTLRHAHEVAHLEAWLSHTLRHVDKDYHLAVELLRCRRLIKGYSDTHARGLTKFDRVCGAASLLAGRKDAADWIQRLREAALQDEAGEALDGALKTVRSFT
ncbi:MAG: hypothetical protein L3J36_05575, partial [Rhodobacteraceae bacterium]|nr:hypothetical protein [Paracoccaceae bacterium]